MLRSNRVEEAINEARTAIDMAPADPRPHLSLFFGLIRVGQKDDARRELQKTIELAQQYPVFRNVEVRAQQELDRLQ